MIFYVSDFFEHILRNKSFNVILNIGTFFLNLLPLLMMHCIVVVISIIFQKMSLHFICSANSLFPVHITINVVIRSFYIKYSWILKLFIHFYLFEVVHTFENIPLLRWYRFTILFFNRIERAINFLLLPLNYHIVFEDSNKNIFLEIVTFFLQDSRKNCFKYRRLTMTDGPFILENIRSLDF